MAISLNYREIAIVLLEDILYIYIAKKHKKLPTMAKVQHK